jgi:hypothetical protein
MKRPRTVTDLLAVPDVCIEASEVRPQLLESHGKGASKKKQDDQKVNTTGQGDCKDREDHGYRRNRQQQSSDQKEKRHFCRPDDAEK